MDPRGAVTAKEARRSANTASRKQAAAERLSALKANVNASESSSLSALQSIAIDLDTDFDVGIRTIKKAILHDHQVDNAEHALEDACIDVHDSKSRNADGYPIGVPTEIASILGDDWRLLPTSFQSEVRHYRGAFPAATDAAATVSQQNGSTTLGKAVVAQLRQFRTELHRPGQHDQTPKPTSRQSDYGKEKLCHQAGFCVHGERGRDIIAIRKAFFRALLRGRFPSADTAGRKALAGARIVLHVCGVSKGPVAHPDDEVEVRTMWLHIGDCNMSTFAIQCHQLSRISPTSVLMHDEIHGEVHLEGRWTFINAWVMSKDLDPSLH